MSGNLWMFSDKLDDEDIEIMKLPRGLKSSLSSKRCKRWDDKRDETCENILAGLC